jgi:DNA-binding response OmpR family regulator
VLIVDTGGTSLAGALHRMGFASEIAGSCAEARTRLAGARFDLMLVELALPDGEGLALARSVRREPGLAGLPVVVASRRRSVLDVIRAAAAGCSGFLAKPATEADLRLAVARALYGRETPDTAPLASEPVGARVGVAHR